VAKKYLIISYQAIMTAMKLERVGYIPSYAERQVVGLGQFCHIFNETTLITLMFDKRCKKVVEAVAKLRITDGAMYRLGLRST